MQPTLKLSINNPCHENWQHMNPGEQGRFCNACAKEVVDFTSMNDSEVLHYFLAKKNENVCGRMYTDQLNRSISKPVYKKNKMSWYWNYFVMLFLLLFKGNAGKAQVTIPKQSPLVQVNKNEQLMLGSVTRGVNVMAVKNIKLYGKVTGKDGMPIPGATVQVKGTKSATSTDMEGLYKLDEANINDVLVFSSVGYVATEMKVNRSGKNDCVLMEAVQGMLSGEVVVTVGGIGADYDHYPPAIPRHVAVLEVRDNVTSQPIKAAISIQKNGEDKTGILYTNEKGIYKLRRIKEDDSYTVTISAAGYKDSVLNIKGWTFNERKETKYVFLQKKINAANLETGRRIILGGVSSIAADPLYILDGRIVHKNKIKDIEPGEIESLDVLNGPSAAAIYGRQGSNGVIFITTKKKKDKNALLLKTVCTTNGEQAKRKKAVAAETDMKFITDFKIAPNPIQKGGLLNISFTAKNAGNYVLQISNDAGALLQLQKVVVVVKDNRLQLQTGANWPAGIYFVSMLGAGNDLINAGSFIIQ